MNNLKKPLFWAYAINFIYWMTMMTFMAGMGPYSITSKIVFGIGAVSFLGALVILERFALFNNNFIWKIYPLLNGTIFLGGGFLLASLTFDILSSGGYDNLWHTFRGIGQSAMLPVGLLMIIFSAIDLVLEVRKQQVQGQAAPSK